MKRIRLVIEYDGSRYCGWQVQPNAPSIQSEIELAIFKLTSENTKIYGCSRTDAGVHARGFVAAFNTDCPIPPEKICLALNTRLPADISVLSSELAEPDFDPRRMATCKRYRYTLFASPIRPALCRKTVWHIKHTLDLEAMEKAAARFVGTHDFTSFGNQERNKPDLINVRTIDRCAVCDTLPLITIDVEGKSFMYNMVRNMVGTLVDVGTGRFLPEDIDRILAARNRAEAGQGAPAQGLCLEWVRYD